MQLFVKMKQVIANNIVKKEILKTLSFHLNPETIQGIEDKEFFKTALKTHLILLGLYIIVNFLLSLLNLSYLVEYSQVMRGFLVEGKISVLMYLLNSFPYNIFFFALSLVIFELFVSISSYFTVKTFGEKNVSFFRCASLVISSNLYVLLSFFPILFFFSLMPNSAKKDIFYMILFIGFVSLFLIIGILLQAISYFRMVKTVFQQNSGRAFLTWFSPFLILLFFFLWTYRPV
ncbi:hypothetical protein JWG44_01725 [Leptospira sp. 201903071]|uniref:hypothetical protein n=1 Tax=Leptospira ainazelensis TaxID=2810034 RepID=UPI001966A44A|nr:hypothetical protein [Leptospira ainazelensis]MBM9498972.1 hypothetical protein [Leptospira ainazelensis]